MKLSGKHIVLTGASGGIGQCLANALAERGAVLLLMGRDTSRLIQLRDELSVADDQNLQHQYIAADLSDESQRNNAIQKLQSLPFDIDILINNAGVSHFGWLEHSDSIDIEATLSSNLLVPMLITRALIPEMRTRRTQIVNVGSTLGAIGYPGYTAYCASKFGLRGFSEALARELYDTPLLVQHIAPRATRTAINSAAVNRMNESLGTAMDSPEWVAEQICKVIEHGKPQVTLGWPEKIIVRLNGLFSELVGKLIALQHATIKQFALDS